MWYKGMDVRISIFVHDIYSSGNVFSCLFKIDDAFFNRDWGGACRGRWARPRLMLDRSTGCASSGLGYDCCCADRQVLNAASLYKKNQKEGWSARAFPVAAPMPKSVSF